MLNKKVIAVALTCAISAGAIGITAGALSSPQSDSTAVSSGTQQNKADSKKNQQNDKQEDKNITIQQTKAEDGAVGYSIEAEGNDLEESEIELGDGPSVEEINDVFDLEDVDGEIETSSVYITDGDELKLTPEQEKQLDEIYAEQEKITQDHADLWEKFYAAQNDYLSEYIDEKAVVDDKDGDDTPTTYRVITSDDVDDSDEEQEYTYYLSDDEAENGGVVFIENDSIDGEYDDFQEMVINKMDNITEEERKLLLDDLQKINELSDKAFAIYEQAATN